jgi:ectoine hydroxylase-related dioxygenase (phytanoyl-CoA dioxygenase family)
MIASFPNTMLADAENIAMIASALDENGAVIVERVAPTDLVDRVSAELRPHFDREGHRFQNEFNGYTTLRLGGILGLSTSSVELIAHELALAMADHVLNPHCECYRIGSCTGIEILPGEADQELHRDDDLYPLRIPGVEYQISAMWALDDFTASNGATRLVPGVTIWIRFLEGQPAKPNRP